MKNTDATLLAECRLGHADAFATLVERYQNLVCAITFSVTGDRGVSEDVAQETFLAAWRSLGEVREPERFRGWLCGIARNLGSKARRRMGRTTELPDEEVADDEVGPEDDLATRESEAMVWRALEEIPETYREPLVLYYREGRSASQVASELGLSVGAVEQRLSRGRRHLKRGVEAMVERSLERSRPSSSFTAAVIAALPLPPGASPVSSSASDSPAPAGATKGRTVMKTLIAASAVMAVGALGYRMESSGGEASGVGRAPVAAPASTEGGASKPRGRDAAGAAEAMAELRAAREREAELQAAGERDPESGVEPGVGSFDYELTPMAPGRFAVNLEGGRSPLTTLEQMPEAPIVRTIRGRVLDAEGHAVAGAVVLGGHHLTMTLARSISAQAGDTSASNGTYTLTLTDAEPTKLLALHREGWSRVESIGIGTEDLERDLRIEPTAALEGNVTRGGEPFEADVWLTLRGDDRGFKMRIPTDAQGHYRLGRVPTGPMKLRATLPMFSGQGSGAWVSRSLTLTSRRTAHVDLAIPEGAFIAVSAVRPEDAGIRMMRYTLLSGSHEPGGPDTLARLRDEVPPHEKRSFLYGGSDLDEVMQFDDVPPGPVTICAEALASKDDVVGMECAQTEIGAPGAKPTELTLHPMGR